MSKIYEALQRAEEERLARGGNPAPKAPPPEQPRAAAEVQTPPVQMAPAFEAPASNFVRILDRRATQDTLTPGPVVTSVRREVESAAIPDNVFDFVVPTVWKPQLEKLPALDERGAAVEQFRSLRTRLFAFRDLNKLKSIMVSSGLPREGKSFIAANLAVSFARHKSTRVLLIDGDMRRSSLHNLFGCVRTPGLSTYLAGHAELPEVLQRMDVPPKSPGLSGLGSLTFIGGGDEGDKAADLSGSKRFQDLIDRASEHFDWIIVDSSPVNLVTDGVNLAHACDAVLMVARGGVTRFEAAQRALKELKSSNILGVILNASEKKTNEIGYYGYDGYETGYDADETPATPTTQEQGTGQVAQ